MAAESLECYAEVDLHDRPIDQGQLFENWIYRDEENRPQGWAYCTSEPARYFGEKGIGIYERVAIFQDFPWSKILTEFGIEHENLHDETRPVYPRHRDHQGTVYEDGQDGFTNPDGSKGDKLDFVAGQLGITNHPDREALLLEWFSVRNDRAWLQPFQSKLPV